jgi:hypothetical protein
MPALAWRMNSTKNAQRLFGTEIAVLQSSKMQGFE